MTVNDAIKAYTEKFGGFPYFRLMGADDNYIIGLVEKALESGKPIEFKRKGGVLY